MIAIRRIAYTFTLALLLVGAVFTGAVQAGQTVDIQVNPTGTGCVVYNNVDPLTPWWLVAAVDPGMPMAGSPVGGTVDCNLAKDPVPVYAIALAAAPFLLPLVLLLLIGPGVGQSRAQRRAAKAAAKAAAAQVAANDAARQAEKAQQAATRAIEG